MTPPTTPAVETKWYILMDAKGVNVTSLAPEQAPPGAVPVVPPDAAKLFPGTTVVNGVYSVSAPTPPPDALTVPGMQEFSQKEGGAGEGGAEPGPGAGAGAALAQVAKVIVF